MAAQPAKTQQGFLLIETLFAAALLALVIAVVAGSLAASYRALGDSKRSTHAAMLLESKLSELRESGVDAPDQGETGPERERWFWRAAPAGECREGLCPVTVSIEWARRGGARAVSATTMLPRHNPEAAP